MGHFFGFRRSEITGLAAAATEAVANADQAAWQRSFDALRRQEWGRSGCASAEEISVESFDGTAILTPGDLPAMAVLHSALRELAMFRQLFRRETVEPRPSTHYSILGQEALAEVVAESEAWDFLMGGVFNSLGMPADLRFMDGQMYATTSWQDAEAMEVLLRDEDREGLLRTLQSHPAGGVVTQDYALVLGLFRAALSDGHELYYREFGT
jgi:hypothetical protein